MTELPSLLVPGLLCTPRLYAAQLPALWTFGPVMVGDHRRDDSMDAIAARILKDAPPRFALIGLSMGGYIAQTMARLAPGRVARLALLDTNSRADPPERSEQRRKQIELALSGRLPEINDLLWPVLVHKNRQHDQALRQIVDEMAQEVGPEAFARQQRAIMGRPDLRPHLPAIKCPTLIMVGDGDLLTPPALSEEMAGLIPGSRLEIIPGSGHLTTLEQPDSVTRKLVEWMS